MRFLAAVVGFLLVVCLCDAGVVVPNRAYRNTEEILVPVAIIQDGEEIKELARLRENEIVPEVKLLAPEEAIAAVVDEEQKLEAIATVVEAERRIDEAVIEEEIKEGVEEEQNQQMPEAVQEEQIAEIVKTVEEEKKIRTTVPEELDIQAVIQPVQASQELEEPVIVKEEKEEGEKILNLKSVVIDRETPNRVVVVVETDKDDAELPEGSLRQATQATPTQTSTQQNFVQQLIQNSPLGQFFNTITGQSTSAQGLLANDETVSTTPAPALPGLFNPVTAVQTAAQTVVNSTTQAFQGLQQFASNLGNQFQNTLSGLGGQQQQAAENDATTTTRPPGPIQQLVNTFMGNQQQTQTPQRPLQGLLNIFQGNNRPQGAAAITTSTPQPAKEPEEDVLEVHQITVDPADAGDAPDQLSDEVRDSAEQTDSFEEITQPDELIVVNDDASETEGEQQQ